MMKESKKIHVLTILILILCVTLLTSISKVPEVQAKFPGINGKIAVQRGTLEPVWKTDIWVINLIDGAEIQLTFDQAGNTEPQWSPDGRKIVFSSMRADNSPNIYVMNEDGSKITRLTYGGGDCEPTWSPDGKKILYKRWIDDGFRLLVMDARMGESGGLTQLTFDGCAGNAVYSPNGKKIAYAFNSYNPDHPIDEIYVMNADGTSKTPLTTYDEGCNCAPSWSPDGKKIAFWRVGQGIYVMNADGTHKAPLTSTSGSDWFPCWSPDGKKIAFLRNDPTVNTYPRANLWVMNADGTGAIQLTHSGLDYAPDWHQGAVIERRRPIPASDDNISPPLIEQTYEKYATTAISTKCNHKCNKLNERSSMNMQNSRIGVIRTPRFIHQSN